MSGYLVDGSYELHVARSTAFTETTGKTPPQAETFADGQTYAAALDSFKLEVETWDGMCDENSTTCNRFYRACIYVAAQARAIATTAAMVWA